MNPFPKAASQVLAVRVLPIDASKAREVEDWGTRLNIRGTSAMTVVDKAAAAKAKMMLLVCITKV